MTINHREGFVKRAAEYGLCRAAAEALYKEAGPLDWLSEKWTNTKDMVGNGVDRVMDNSIVHGVKAINPLSDRVKGFGDYFTGIPDRFNAAENDSDQTRGAGYAESMLHRLQQGDAETAQEYANLATERAGDADTADSKNYIMDKLTGATSQYNTQAQQQFAAQQAAQKAQQQALEAAQARVQPPTIWQPGMPMGSPPPPKPSVPNGFNPLPPQGAPQPPQPPAPPSSTTPGFGTPQNSQPTSGIQAGSSAPSLAGAKPVSSLNTSFARKPYGMN